MLHPHFGAEKDAASSLAVILVWTAAKAQTEVNILEPEREEALIEASTLIKTGPPY
jgi:hypothetical protein